MFDPVVAAPAAEKRTWCYVQRPSDYEVAPCSCGNHKTQWSEFVGHLWCDRCQKDFVPAHNGVFDGPIPIELAKMMGISFDRVNLETGRVDCLNLESGEYGPKDSTSLI